ncbi:hypothetical protein SBOR_3515 [Sclerotinia borealis F-4128]|uniref:Uncharacterized protein n=1 Tax=Sclerotinia borealis (strain F-4128) TaxID=1432307 RepID=W9CJS9_SCLBF|nr:hypothetical protein SBOR_3515 [Sclerotinia borealis F-4128]
MSSNDLEGLITVYRQRLKEAEQRLRQQTEENERERQKHAEDIEGERKRRMNAEQITQKTTLMEYLRLCHEHLFEPISIETNKTFLPKELL